MIMMTLALAMDMFIECKMKKNFFNVLHELVNLMKDHEQGIIYWDDVISDNLFPEFKSAERVVW